ncbi:MAG TPA: SigB/SigF/SigG family RNA polymerase sigma factor [Micromonosporaceae bacterium]|nr:SigB/SigF/SigG family RNA polymerase sigma factor [Micromonosporaceae bacterium]
MRIEVRRLGEADLVVVDGDLDLATNPCLRAVLDNRLAEGRHHLVVDLHDVRLLDAGAIGLLVGVAERAGARGGSLRAIGARGMALEVLEIASVDKRLRTHDEPEAILLEYGAAEGAQFEPDPAGVPQRWPGSEDITVAALLAAATATGDSAVRARLRNQVIEDNIPFATRLARRFRDRGEPVDDLTQVAMVGLVNAVNGYDPARGCEFASYATPTIVGEIRRYFRDKGWRIKVPRRLQELRMRVNRASVELSQSMGASPGIPDIAAHLGVSTEEVAEAIEVAQHYHPVSLSAPAGPDADLDISDPIGDVDPGMEAVDNRESVRPLLAALPERQRRILAMRFFGEMTQSQIAEELGISQMHVSRLLTQTLQKLRSSLVEA